MRLVNAYHDFSSLFLISRSQEGERIITRQPATFDVFEPDGKRRSFTKFKQRKEYVAARPDLREADVMPPRRYISDNFDVVIQKPRVVALDIETDSRVPFSRKEDMRVLCYALADEDGFRKVNLLRGDTDDDERALLRELLADIAPYDCVTGWNLGDSWDNREFRAGQWLTLPGSGFDAPVIRARCRRYAQDQRGLETFMQQWLWLDTMLLWKRCSTTASSGEERQSFALDHVARMTLGEGKAEFDSKNCWEAWSAGGTRRQRMADYCMRDTEIIIELEKKRGYIELYKDVCQLCNVFVDTHGIKPTELFDGILLRMGAERGVRFPTKPKAPKGVKEKGFTGAFVMDPPEAGVIHNVRVADFAALYSSIIRSWNISAETFAKPGSITPMSGRTYDNTALGMLPTVLSEFAEKRKKWKALAASLPEGSKEWKDADRISTALKVLGNSGYGVASSKYSRFGSSLIGESITQTGVFLLKRTKAYAEEMGLTVIYGDTDSLFIQGATEDQFKTFLHGVNTELLPSLTKHYGCIQNVLKIDSDKTLEFVVFSAKKRYAGKFETGYPCIKGFEYLRGDVTKLAANMQKEIIDKFVTGDFDPENYHLIITKHRNHILHDELSLDEVKLAESLSKDPAEYDVTSPVVTVARILQERGEQIEPGTKLAYFVTDGSVSPLRVAPASDYTGECDRHWIWQTGVYPASQRFLAASFPLHDWERWADTRPKPTKEQKYQAKWEKRGQLRLPF